MITETSSSSFTCKMFSKLVYLLPAFLSVVTGTRLSHSAAKFYPSTIEDILSNFLSLLPALFGVLNLFYLKISLVRSLDARGVALILDVSTSTLILTGEKTDSNDVAPVGVRQFCKVISSSSMNCLVSATIIISRDNYYSFFAHSFVFTVGLKPEGYNFFAIAVENVAGPAGLMATILAMNAVCPGGWASPSYNDLAWTPAVPDGPTESTFWKSHILPPALNMTGMHEIQTNKSVSSGNGEWSRPQTLPEDHPFTL
ncbi:hypothetical protein IW262DRAFT_1460578 [Armillaria fumosa]|nr:hypothetical protein IW262DRAFT_1460578 [Armillaria fumosa]